MVRLDLFHLSVGMPGVSWTLSLAHQMSYNT